MHGAQNLSEFSMLMCGLLLLIPLLGIWYLKLGMVKSLLISTIRMIVQLVLVGFFLEFLFRLNNWLLNSVWFLTMITVAVLSVIKNSNLRLKLFCCSLFQLFHCQSEFRSGRQIHDCYRRYGFGQFFTSQYSWTG